MERSKGEGILLLLVKMESYEENSVLLELELVVIVAVEVEVLVSYSLRRN